MQEEGVEADLLPLRTGALYPKYVEYETAWADYIDANNVPGAEPTVRRIMDKTRFCLWIKTASAADVKEAFRKWGRTPQEYVQYLLSGGEEWRVAV